MDVFSLPFTIKLILFILIIARWRFFSYLNIDSKLSDGVTLKFAQQFQQNDALWW